MKIGTKILFVTRKNTHCGVADYGLRVFDILKKELNIVLAEVSSLGQLTAEYYQHRPDVVIYNYHYATLDFLDDDFLKDKKEAKHLAVFHEAHMRFKPDEVLSTLIRPLFEDLSLMRTANELPTIGSFGFGFPDKDFARVAQVVKDQYDEAILRLHIPFAEYGDKDGFLAKRQIADVRKILEGSKIQLQFSHEYKTPKELLTWLSRNDLNLFLYRPSAGRGISSAIDYALSVRKPIGVSDSEMFRHLPKEVCIDHTPLKELSIEPLKKVYEENSNKNLIEYYRQTISRLLN